MKGVEIKCQGAAALPIEELTNFQGGLKKITKDSMRKLKDRILKSGFIAPIFIWQHEDNNYILDGHQRIQALLSLKKEGYEIPALPVAYVHATSIEDAKEKLLSITSQYGEFVLEELETWLKDFDEDMRDSFRFVNDEMKINIFDEPEDTSGDDQVPEEVQPISKPGDVWTLGDHRLMCGDSTSEQDVAKLMDGDLAHLIFTDPPYGVSYTGSDNPSAKAWEMIQGDNLRSDDLYKLLYGAFLQLFKNSIENPAVYIWHASRTQMIFETAINDAGFEVKEQLIWNKGMVLARSDYHWSHEPMFYCRKKGQNNKWFGDRKQRTIMRHEKIDYTTFKKSDLILILETLAEETTNWEIKRDAPIKYLHPTQKPVDLAMRAIRNNTTPTMNIVLDLFSGSASTIIACEKSKRKGRSMEIDPQYVDIGVNRYIAWCEKNYIQSTVLLNGKPWSQE